MPCGGRRRRQAASILVCLVLKAIDKKVGNQPEDSSNEKTQAKLLQVEDIAQRHGLACLEHDVRIGQYWSCLSGGERAGRAGDFQPGSSDRAEVDRLAKKGHDQHTADRGEAGEHRRKKSRARLNPKSSWPSPTPESTRNWLKSPMAAPTR